MSLAERKSSQSEMMQRPETQMLSPLLGRYTAEEF